jgi:hypothetical protein
MTSWDEKWWARAWRILYTTTRDERNTPTVASGLVIAPEKVTHTAVRVIAWAHGTTGFASGCAPSVLKGGLGGGAMYLQDKVAQGWAMVATDYVGLGTEGPHPYLIGQGEGRSVLHATAPPTNSRSSSSRRTPSCGVTLKEDTPLRQGEIFGPPTTCISCVAASSCVARSSSSTITVRYPGRPKAARHAWSPARVGPG